LTARGALETETIFIMPQPLLPTVLFLNLRLL